MKCIIIEYYFKCGVSVGLGCFLLMCWSCSRDGLHGAAHTLRFEPTEQVVFDSFMDYLQNLSEPNFQLAAFISDEKLFGNPVYTQKILEDQNLQFFPAILWQLYALRGAAKWKDMAEKFSLVLHRKSVAEELIHNDGILYASLARYLATYDPVAKTTLLDALARDIIEREAHQASNCLSNAHSLGCVEPLLDLPVFFLATKETGDPVYAQLAQHQVEWVFEHYFQEESENEWFTALANENTVPKAEGLVAQDLTQLAIILYGFTLFNQEQENERYHLLCRKLAAFFTSMLTAGAADNASKWIGREMDPLPQILVCLALHTLENTAENADEGKAEEIFQQLLNRLASSGKKKMKGTPPESIITYSNTCKYEKPTDNFHSHNSSYYGERKTY